MKRMGVDMENDFLKRSSGLSILLLLLSDFNIPMDM